MRAVTSLQDERRVLKVASDRDRARTTVIVVDDRMVVAHLVEFALRSDPDLDVLAVASSVAEGAELRDEHRPDVVVVNPWTDRGSDPVVNVRRLAGGHGAVVALVIDAGGSATDLRDAGATALVGHDESVAGLVDAVRSAGGSARVAVAESSERIGALSARDREIIACLADGLSNPEIGERLFLSPNTVRNYVQRVLSRLGAHSKHEAVAIAYKERLVRLPGSG